MRLGSRPLRRVPFSAKISFIQLSPFHHCASHLRVPRQVPLPSLVVSFRRFTHKSSIDWNQNDEFFRFTKGRFVVDEEKEMALRHNLFDMNALARIAAEAAGSPRCVKVEKTTEGMYNKIFLMTMEDGSQVFAKVPDRNVRPGRFITASEVATMEFVRTVLGTPAPKVLAWNSRADSSPVGAEYIITERVPGVPFAETPSLMDIKEQFHLVQSVADLQQKWMSAKFKDFGSLYFRKDLGPDYKVLSYTDENGVEVIDERFSVGPTVERRSYEAGRGDINFDRGPCKFVGFYFVNKLTNIIPGNSIEDYFRALGLREATCIKAVNKLPNYALTLPGLFVPTKQRKLDAVEVYLRLIKYALPTDPTITTATLWHQDLHSHNIIVDPNDRSKITGILDWENTVIAPLFWTIQNPWAFLDYKGPEVKEPRGPEFPETAGMSEAEKASAIRLWQDAKSIAYHRAYIRKYNATLHRALEFEDTTSYNLLIPGQVLFQEGEATMLAIVAADEDFKSEWPKLPGVQAQGNPPIPFNFTEKEVEAISKDYEDADEGINFMEQLRQCMGDLWPEKGIVRHDEYVDVKNALRDAKKKALEEFVRTEEGRKVLEEWWPFDD